MPIPNNPMLLIDPSAPDFTAVDGWEMKFARYQWFYIPGYRRIMNDAGLYNISSVKSFIDQALTSIPETWRSKIPNGDWNTLAANQIERAVDGKVMRLEKALLAIICLNHAVSSIKSRNMDIFNIDHPIAIRPALFLVDGFNEIFYQNNIKPNKARLEALSLGSAQRKREVFEHMAKGYSVTCRTATKTCEVLSTIFADMNPGWDSSRIMLLEQRARRDRNNNSLSKMPNKHETIVYP